VIEYSDTSVGEATEADASAPRVLLTGFQPYNGAEQNSSREVVRALDGCAVGGFRLVGRVFPVSTAAVGEAICNALDELQPALVLMLGVWPGRQGLSVERVAINVLDFPFPDNDGAQPSDAEVIPRGPDAFLSTVSVRATLEAWAAHGLPGSISNSAGTYLCNQSFYTALHHTAGSGIPVGFIHLPALPAEAARHDPPHPSMALSTLVEGVRVALGALLPAGNPAPPVAG
jgi:pyroglutamyl-peptidase